MFSGWGVSGSVVFRLRCFRGALFRIGVLKARCFQAQCFRLGCFQAGGFQARCFQAGGFQAGGFQARCFGGGFLAVARAGGEKPGVCTALMGGACMDKLLLQ